MLGNGLLSGLFCPQWLSPGSGAVYHQNVLTYSRGTFRWSQLLQRGRSSLVSSQYSQGCFYDLKILVTLELGNLSFSR